MSPAVLGDSVMQDAGEHRVLFAKLIKASHGSYIDLNTTIPWALGADRSKLPKAEDHMWLYGTPYFERLTEAQKREMAWLEVARDASMFIHFEQIIPPTYSGYVNQLKGRLDPTVYEYLMLFAREELTHILMFHRYLETAGLPWYGLPESYAQLAKKLPSMAPEVGVLYTLLIEWTAENAVVAAVARADVDPLTKTMWTQHHKEETRHIVFGKQIGEEYFRRAKPEEAQVTRAHLRALVGQLHYVYNYNPEIARYLSFELPFDGADPKQEHLIRSSAHNVRLNAVRFADIVEWCKKVGIL